jgi:hypothetical protein
VYCTNTAHRAFGTDIVTIYVGAKRKTFKLHKNLLCDRSDYFSKALNGGFQKGQAEMYLPEDDPTPFGHLVNYFYRDALPQFPCNQYPGNPEGCGNYVVRILCALFFLAEKLCMNELSNKTLDTIQDLFKEYHRTFDGEEIRSIYSSTHQKSKLRMYVALKYLSSFEVCHSFT